MHELNSLREARDALDDQIQRMEWGLGPCPPPSGPQPVPSPSQNYPSSHLFHDNGDDTSTSSTTDSSSSNGTSGFRSAGSLQETDNASESSSDDSRSVMPQGRADASSSFSSSSSSSSDYSFDAGDDAELAGYQEALDNLKQQRDAVSASTPRTACDLYVLDPVVL